MIDRILQIVYPYDIESNLYMTKYLQYLYILNMVIANRIPQISIHKYIHRTPTQLFMNLLAFMVFHNP